MRNMLCVCLEVGTVYSASLLRMKDRTKGEFEDDLLGYAPMVRSIHGHFSLRSFDLTVLLVAPVHTITVKTTERVRNLNKSAGIPGLSRWTRHVSGNHHNQGREGKQ
ncbi:hypothetical protein F4861DRAFT_446604 [Xylaria intraflava]|nr:hypothetical protein F4861DRAFT_446604 [Xylaria intraflava]